MTNSAANHFGVKRWTNIILIGLLALLLWLPSLDLLFHFDHTPPFNEKRVLAQFPKFKPGLAGIKEFIAGLEAYFNDHFGCRNQLILWHAQWQLMLFNDGKSDVMMGKAGWLFFDENQMHLAAHYQGMLQFSPQELSSLKNMHERRRDWLAQRGIRYVFVVAPDKQSIYPEYLPSWLTPVRHHTKLDQFIDYMHSRSTVTILDLRPALRAAKRIALTYYKTDSHWNFFGGFVAGEEIIKELAYTNPDFKPLSLDYFELKKQQLIKGDLTTLLGGYAVEESISLTPKKNLPPLMETVLNPEFTVPTYYTSNSNARGICVVFRDSFGPALKPFLGYHFQKVGYFWAPGGFETNIIEEMKPSVVISEIVERHFNYSSK